jgi:hypothetical protein
VHESFYPPAASRLGINLRRTLVIRTKQGKDALAALAQSLRCQAVGAVIGPWERLAARDFRRLQLAAEAGGGIAFLLRPVLAQGNPSFAAVRLLLSPLATREGRRRLQVEVIRLRFGKAGQSLLVEVDDETGHVRVLSPLAAAKATTGPAGA